MKNKLKIVLLIIICLISMGWITYISFAYSGEVTGNGTSIRIREEASTSSDVISVATQGEKVEILGEEGNWYKVKFENITGYISKDFIKTDGNESQITSSENNNTVTNETVNNVIVNSVTNEDISEEKNEILNTSNSSVDNVENNETENVQSIIGEKKVLENDVSLRRVPVYSSKEFISISKGTEVEIKSQLNKWVQISNETEIGWVYIGKIGIDESTSTSNNSSMVINDSLETTSDEVKKGVVNIDSARIRTSPNGEVLDVVSLNDEVEILEEDGDWLKINTEDYKGCYIAKRLVTEK